MQLQSVEQASAAIHALNGSFPRGAQQPLLVRYADSPGGALCSRGVCAAAASAQQAALCTTGAGL